MRIVLLVGDSYVSYLIARAVLKSGANSVGLVLLSTRFRRSPGRTARAISGCSRRWLGYRLFVAAKSLVLGVTRGMTVERAAAAMGIPVLRSGNLSEMLVGGIASDCEMAVAVNLDQMLTAAALRAVRNGALNVHASRLPDDKGVSPALWAYARGDDSIWISVYQVDEGLDSGPLFAQREVWVQDCRTAVEMYERVCAAAGLMVAQVIDGVETGAIAATAQPDRPGSYHGVPDAEFDAYLNASGRRLLDGRDLLRVLRVGTEDQ